MSVIIELNITPIGKGTSISKFLTPALKKMDSLGVKYSVTPMCTIFETKTVEKAFNIVKVVHESVFRKGVKRVLTNIKIDDRRDIERTMGEKVKSLVEKL